MSKASARKRGLTDIMTDMLEHTREMLSQKDDADLVMDTIEKRSVLISEFDALIKNTPADEFALLKPELHSMANEMLKMDGEIMASLQAMKESAKQDLKDSTQQNKVMGYASKAISSSGSYLDYKE